MGSACDTGKLYLRKLSCISLALSELKVLVLVFWLVAHQMVL